jgi:hypothetical protein
MATGQQRATQQRLAAQAAALEATPDLPPATVIDVTPNASDDGVALVTVDYLGAELPVAYVAQYTPVVGDRVLVLKVGGLLTILGRPVGFPQTTGVN